MTRGRIAVVAATMLLAPLAGASSAPSWAGASPTTHVLGCGGHLQVRPANYVLSCADANAQWAKVTWSSWGATSATGVGTLSQNNCTPNCVGGRVINYAATVTLRRVVSTTRYGRLFSEALFHLKVHGKVTSELFSLAH